MKKRLFYTGLTIVSILHIYMLYKYGISTFVGTCLLYFFLYKLCTFISDGIFRENQNKIIRHNIKSIFIILIILEFLLLFIFKPLNSWSENEVFIYLSEYKRKEIQSLVNKIGFKQARFTYTDFYQPKSSQQIKREEFNITHQYNKLGLRGFLPSVQKSTNEYRIIVLGDSYAEGVGAKESETLPVQLQKQLSASFPNKKISVINAGINGSNPIYEINSYNRILSKYKADLVILLVFPNDLPDIDIMQNNGVLPMGEYAFALSHIYRSIYLNSSKYENLELEDSITSNKWIKLMDYLNIEIQRFRNSLHEAGQQLILVYIPSKGELEGNPIPNTYPKTLQKYLKPEINLADSFSLKYIHRDSLSIYYWEKDEHFNTKGYKLAAEIIARHVISKHYVGTH